MSQTIVATYRNATPSGEPIFMLKNGDTNMFVTLRSVQQYKEFLQSLGNQQNMWNHLDIHIKEIASSKNNNTLDTWLQNNKDAISFQPPTVMEERKFTAFSHLISYDSFQYTMEKQLFGFAHYEKNGEFFIFDRNQNLNDVLYRYYGRNFASVNFYTPKNYENLTAILQDMDESGVISPIFTFNGIASEFIQSAIEESRATEIQFLHPKTPLSFKD